MDFKNWLDLACITQSLLGLYVIITETMQKMY